MTAEKELFRRFRIEYIDAEGKRRRFALTPAIMQIKDIIYLRHLIDALRERSPEVAQCIVEIAKLIVAASEHDRAAVGEDSVDQGDINGDQD